ncbi:MAG: SCO family protein [Acidobacteriota bacterium]|jgi:protein SCO1/2
MTRNTLILATALTLAVAVAGVPAAAQFGPPRPEPIAGEDGQPRQTEGVELEQKLGAQVPLSTEFLDETGAPVTLADLAEGRPIVLVPAYYECPMLCSLVLNGVVSSLDTLEFDADDQFEVIVFSFDPGETPEVAMEAKERYLARYDRPGAGGGFHFLTGEEESIRAVTEAIGYRYNYVPEKDEYAHTAGIVILTPGGSAARYFYGVEYPPRDVRLALVEAADETIGNAVDEVLLYCFRYDPETGRYSAAILNIVRLGGVLTLAALGLFMLWSWRRGRLRTAEGEA